MAKTALAARGRTCCCRSKGSQLAPRRFGDGAVGVDPDRSSEEGS